MEEHRIQRATDGTTSDPEDIPEPVLDVVDADDTLSEAADSVETLVDVVPDQ